MIQRVVGFCFMMVGLSVAAPASKKGAYAPAPPGVRPTCATKGMTFCEDVDKYPAKLIQKLLMKSPVDTFDFFVDESEGLDEPPEHVLLNEETDDGYPMRRSNEEKDGDGYPIRRSNEETYGRYPMRRSNEDGYPTRRSNEETNDGYPARRSRVYKRSVKPDPDDGLLSKRCSVPSDRATPKIVSKEKGEWRFTTPAEASGITHKIEIRVCDEKEECRKSCTQFYTPLVKQVGKDEEDLYWVPSSCRCFDQSDNLI